MNVDRLEELMWLHKAGRRVIRCTHEDVEIDDLREILLLAPDSIEESYLGCSACARDVEARLPKVSR